MIYEEVQVGADQRLRGKATLTAAGRAVANMPSCPWTTKDLQERIFHLLGEGERKMLTLLIAAFPESLTRVELAGQAGYSNAKSGGFAAPLARLVEVGFCGNSPVWSRAGKRNALSQKAG